MASYVLRSLMNTQLQRTYIYMKKESGRLKLNNSSLNQTSSFSFEQNQQVCWKHATAQKNSFLMILPFAIPFIFTFFIVPFCSFFVSLKYYPEILSNLVSKYYMGLLEHHRIYKYGQEKCFRLIKYLLVIFLSHS